MKYSMLRRVAGAALLTTGAAAAVAAPIGGHYDPYIATGTSNADANSIIDPNVAASPYSGVVSINIRYDGLSYICSGTLVSNRDVVTAGHCVDTNGNGALIDITKPGNDVRVVFNAGAGAGSAVMTATKVSMNPNYQGFGNCPAGVPGFCVNDDVAVVTLGADAPAAARRYGIWAGGMTEGMQINMVGYGTSGNGWDGYTIGPAFRVKRSGYNVTDLFDLDDEQNFAAGPQEVWYADFDGVDRAGNLQDFFCANFGVCTAILGHNIESNIGGGDSGGSSFINAAGQLLLAGNNTFGWNTWYPDNSRAGTFGTAFGGMNLSAYTDYLLRATDGRISLVPEPGTYALLGVALLAMGATRRRKSS